MTTNNSCRCAYPRCTCETSKSLCLFNALIGFDGRFGPLPSLCLSSHPFLEMTSCSGNNQTVNFGLGNNKLSSLDPFVTSGCGCEVYVVLPPCTVLRFNYNEETEVYEGESDYCLVYRNNEFSLTKNDDGEPTFFRGFEPGEQNPGRLIKRPAANGSRNSLEAFDPDNPGGDPYTANGNLKGLRVVETVNNVEITYAYMFDYNADGNMTVATIKRKEDSGSWENLHRVLFTYYSGGSSSSSSSGGSSGDEYGSAGDMQSATEQIYVNGQWSGDRVTYWRYYVDGESNGNVHQVKYVLGPEQYERLAADPAVSDPLTASNAKVAEYAATYFEYDSAGEVSLRKEVGSLATTFQSETSGYEGTSSNSWQYKTVETRGDGGVRTRYENFRSQPLLEEFKESASATESTFEFRQYDSNGNLTLHATSSALESYSISNYVITPTYKSDGGQFTVGLVHLYDYYSETTTGTGGVAVAGRKQHDKIRQGRDGTPIKLRTYEYTEHSAIIVPPAIGGSSSSSSSSGGLSSEFTATIYPIAKVIEYRNEDGSGQIETSYAYEWHLGTLEMQQRVTTLPVVPVTQNGSGVAATRTERFDQYGNLTWSKDERGYITYHAYDIALGKVRQTIQDFDDGVLTLPSGWSTPADGGKHIVSDYEYDDLGRQTQMLGPEHTVDIGGTAKAIRQANWTVYDDVNLETRSAQGYYDVDAETYTLINPVSIQKRNAAGTRAESIQATRASTSEKLTSADTLAQSSYVRWSVAFSNSVGQRTASRVYHTIPTSGDGLSGTNYDETTFEYDSLGRQNIVTSPGGTITWNVFDRQDRAVCSYVGTNAAGGTDDDPSVGREPCSILGGGSSSSSSSSSASGAAGNNMVLVSQRQYGDGGCSSCGSGGGQLTLDIQYVDANTTRITEFQYDWRGRQEFVIPPADDEGRTVYTQSHYDNLDHVVKTEQYHEKSVGDDILVTRYETFFDDRGQTYHTRRYGVDLTTGDVGNYLASYTWFDAAGNTIKQQASGQRSFTKTAYDSLGRAVKQYVGYDLSESPCVDIGGGNSSSSSSSTSCVAYSTATNVTGDTIFEQTETDYDDTSNVIETRLRRRHHDATGTGELTTPAGSQPRARVGYAAHYSDAAGRQQATANYGTNDDVVLTRSSTVPTRSDTILVTSTEYDDVGQAFKAIDPSGKEDRTFFNDAGRVIKTIENYTDGDPTTGNADEDRTVEFTYTADGQRATITAKQQSASDEQTTTYVYGTTLADSNIARSDLLRAEVYPDSDDVGATGVPPVLSNGTDNIYDRIEYTYNRQRQRLSTKDQNGSIHEYDYDDLGRQLHDRITTLGSDVDGVIRRLSTTYEIRGQMENATSYDNATVGSGSVVNEVLREYNDYGLLDKEYQEHDGAKDGSTPYVGYNYDETAVSSELESGLRPTSLRYPNGRLVHYTYGSTDSAADALNRLDAINDDDSGSPGDVLASYTYLGLGTVVIQDYEEPDVKLDLFGGTSGTYAGFDRFDRIVDHRWHDYGSSVDVDRYKYGYDRASNRIWKENVVAANNGKDFDEFYTYDGLHRLQNFDRGDLNAGKTAISGTPANEEDWTLDPLGNWQGFVQKTSGTTDLNQSRTVNEVNEITNITETTGPSWITPAFDRNGNMTTVPKPADPTIAFTCSYDAWNRMVKVEEGMTTVAEYAYDALKRRISKDVDSTVRHFLYSSAWQSLEERLDASNTPERQHIWGPQYVDQLILRDRDTSEPINGTLDERLYALQDAKWNVITLVDSSSTVIERCLYEPYGKITLLDGSFGSKATSNVDTSYTFSGRRLDSESGLYYYRNRFYDARLGQFVSRDPIGYKGQDFNPYRYVGNRPTNATDPSGNILEFEYDCDSAKAKLQELRDQWEAAGYVFGVETLDLIIGGQGGNKHPRDMSHHCSKLVSHGDFRRGLGKHFGAAAPCKASQKTVSAPPGTFRVEFLQKPGLLIDLFDDWIIGRDETMDFFGDLDYTVGTGSFGYEDMTVTTTPIGCCCRTDLEGTIILRDTFHFTRTRDLLHPLKTLESWAREWSEFWEAGVYLQEYCGKRPLLWEMKCPIKDSISVCPGTLWGQTVRM
ncbi:MAG: RHS repeat-associated core domain-containing protein [Planctomycetales bacterium]|nr:RHS repeat-associated core domain-containing protein [Planctomycetales bacterium]